MINKLFRQKVKGGALQYTILFSLLILMSLSLFLMFVRLSSLEVYSSQKQSQLVENINSAIVILENQSQLFEKQQLSLQLLEDTTYGTNIEISEWGFYDKVKIVSWKGMLQLSKMYLFADNIKTNKQIPSLYLSGARQYLSVGGKTYLGNNTFLPGYGIRKSYINGIGYSRDSLVQGKSFKADKTLPKLNGKWAERYSKLKNRIDVSSSRPNMKELKKDSINVSFKDETLILQYPDNYSLNDKYLNGNIIITGTKIRIANTSHIHQCIVLADTIIVEKQFKGDVQLLAEDYIEIGESSTLKAPSVLYLNNSDKNDQILVKSQTKFQGEIIIPHLNLDRKEILVIEDGCKMIGQIYCNGFASFDGILFGSFYATGFMERSRSGLYENYLVDVCIDSKRLPDEYFGISLINKSNAKACTEELH
jgi:hypothetical protein